MQVEIRGLEHTDIELMAELMRPMDRFEFDVMGGGKPPIEDLTILMERSKSARACYMDGKLVAVWGILPPTVLSTVGFPWLAATDEIDRPEVRRKFIAMTKPEFGSAVGSFTRLWNLISEENTIAIRWLKWIGFGFDGRSTVIKGHRFLFFEMT